jgi:hypothetical protein
MSRQGISKPGAPILAPEFTNPLFLKVCCKALKDSGLTCFPKGLRGLSSLFEFYLQSIEKSVARRKKYSLSEKIIKKALEGFASEILPDHFDGLPIEKARKLIDGFDPNPNNGNTLFNELIYEGVLSEDISYDKNKCGHPVIRFTYERFSDYFIALQIAEQYDEKTVRNLFSEDGTLGKIIETHGYYRFQGIFTALSVILAEKFRIELIDLLPADLSKKIGDWTIDRMFSETVIWRSPDSFTDRTRELLRNLSGYGHESPVLDILLKLSTEPEHPWNANLIHEILINKSIAERDYLWSTHIALGDQIEGDGGEESIVRTLIEWSYSGEINGIEEERVRLCAITLFWFLTTPNRKVRDQTTKSLVRLLAANPGLLPELLNKFHAVNDLYLLERLYAVAYGVICNIDDNSLISEIALIVYDLVFKDGEPIPHILLRDYARGILEYALHRKLIPDSIVPEQFRPPYKSDWPIANPSEEDINKIEKDDDFSYRIKSSLMSFPGDFGNYTMSCIHNWSPTPLSEPSPKTGYEYKKEFAKEFLSGEIKERYLEKMTNDSELSKKATEPLSIRFISVNNEEVEKDKKAEESFHEQVQKNLNGEQKEYYRWLSGLKDDHCAEFSRKWAQRWVCMRAHELGWTKKLFEDFEKVCSYGRGGGFSGDHMERMGKKYQWIALHELLARLSDNVHWIDRGYSDIEDERYYGPWQMYKRNIDPTIWIRGKAEDYSHNNKQTTWWQRYKFPLNRFNGLEEQLKFMQSESDIPDFSKILDVPDPQKSGDWMVLGGFWWETQGEDMEQDAAKLDAWFRINSIIIKKGDFKEIRESIVTRNLIEPGTVSIPSTQNQGFFGEYPWHPSCHFTLQSKFWRMEKCKRRNYFS